MIPFLLEMPAGIASAPAPSGAALPSSAPEGSGLDFAGLLGAALPQIAPRTTPQPAVSGGPAPAFLPDAGAPPPALPAAPPATLPPGKNMPEPGAILPPPVTLHGPGQSALLPPSVGTGRPLAPSHDLPEAPVAAPQPQPAAMPDSAAPVVPEGEAAEPAPSEPLTAPEDAAAILPDPPVALPVPPIPVALMPAPPAPPAPAPPAPAPGSDARQSARLPRGLIVQPAGGDTAPMPARVTLPLAPAEDADAPQAAALSPLPAQPLPPASPSPEAQPPALAAPPPALATPAPDRIEAPRAPAPQQEAAIAQVSDLREALRSVRPEMTLRHAEFGFVSLRLEAAGPQDWRAVLASRDPGFVPAIQSALADRAVAAASASADSGQFMGQNGAGQNGTSDQRYGASPNGGQAGLSPYLGQSGGRDGEAAPDHRRPSTAAAMAARAEDGEEASGSPARQTGGMFA